MFRIFTVRIFVQCRSIQLQWREQDLSQMKTRHFRRNPLNRHFGRARIAEGVSKQKLHLL